MSTKLYIHHPTDPEQSQYVVVKYHVSYEGDDIDDLDILEFHPEDKAEWISEDILLDNLLSHLKKQTYEH